MRGSSEKNTVQTTPAVIAIAGLLAATVTPRRAIPVNLTTLQEVFTATLNTAIPDHPLGIVHIRTTVGGVRSGTISLIPTAITLRINTLITQRTFIARQGA